MNHLYNIIDLDTFTALREGKDNSITSTPWWKDCIDSVEMSVLQDRTTTKDDLHEKAKNYALNYMAMSPEGSFIDREHLANLAADEVEERLKDTHFDQKPLAGIVAQQARDTIAEEPENKYIKLR